MILFSIAFYLMQEAKPLLLKVLGIFLHCSLIRITENYAFIYAIRELVYEYNLVIKIILSAP